MAKGGGFLERSNPDLDTAVLLAEASAAAYDDGKARAFAQTHDLSGCTLFNSGNVQGFHCATKTSALLVFRGTSNIGQWIRDVRVLPRPFRDWGWAHLGFVAGVEAVESHLKVFDKIARERAHVWLAGHSLGGALAVLAGARLKSLGVCAPNIITFGQPAVGFGGFAERFNTEMPGRLWRIVNQSDVVPRTPPFPYRHCELGKHITQPGVLEAPLAVAAHLGLAARDASQADTLREIIYGGAEMLEGAAPQTLGARVGLSLEAGAPPPLDPVEFGRLQLALGADESAGLEGMALEGAIPFLEDHGVQHYVDLLTDIRNAVSGRG